MSQNSENISGNQEIDLLSLFKYINIFFERISMRIFRGILFLKRNLLVIGILFVIGLAVGFYLDKTKRIYESQIIVTPNFGSVDYLYERIELLDSRIQQGDVNFLKQEVGILHPEQVLDIEIKPINDVYNFIEHKVQNLEEKQNENLNFEMIKLLAEDGELKKILEDPTTSKHYPNQNIKIITSHKVSYENIIKPILKYLNTSDFYNEIKIQSLKNTREKIAQNDSIIFQINNLLQTYKSSDDGKLVFLDKDIKFQLNDLIRTKDYLIREKGEYNLKLIKENQIIKNSNMTLNTFKKQIIGGKFKIIMPFLFVLAFVFVGAFGSYYRRQMAKIN